MSANKLIDHTDRILATNPKGRDCSRLAKEYDVCYVTMWKFLTKQGVIFNRETLDDATQQLLIADYRSGKRPDELAVKYDVGSQSVLNYVTRHGVERLPQPRQSTINRDFFKTLTPESLWVLGWFFSDGHVSGTSHRFTIGVQRSDEEVLVKIRDLMGIDADSIDRPANRNFSSFYGCDGTIHADLLTLGCVPRKSLIIEYPKMLVEPWQHWAFLRGVVEGDGHLSFKSNANRPGFVTTIASGSLRFLQSIQSVLKRLLVVDSFVETKAAKTHLIRGVEAKFSTSYTLRIEGGRESIMRFLDAIYDNGNAKHYLERKYQTYLKMKEVMSRPHDVSSINRDRQTEVHLRSPEGVIYHVKGTRPFAREMGLSNAAIRNLLKPRKRRLSRGIKWSIATFDQIAAARALGTLIERFY